MRKASYALLLALGVKVCCEISLDGIRKAFTSTDGKREKKDTICDASIVNPLYGWLLDKSGALRNRRMFSHNLGQTEDFLGAAYVSLFPSPSGELSHLSNHSTNFTKSLESVARNYENNQKELIAEQQKAFKDTKLAPFDAQTNGLKLKLLALLFVKSYLEEYKIEHALSVEALDQQTINIKIKEMGLFINQNKRKAYASKKLKFDAEDALCDTTDMLIVSKIGDVICSDFTMYLSKVPRITRDDKKVIKGHLETVIEFYANHNGSNISSKNLSFPIKSKAWLMQAYVARALEDKELPLYLQHVHRLLECAKFENHVVEELLSLKMTERVFAALQHFPYSEVLPPSSYAWVNAVDNVKNIMLPDVYADCVEISLLHVLNCIFFDVSTEKFVLSHLNAGNEQTQKLREFYAKNSGIFHIDQAAHQQWAAIMSNISSAEFNVRYAHEKTAPEGTQPVRYEALTGFINAFNLVACVTGYGTSMNAQFLAQFNGDVGAAQVSIQLCWKELIEYARADKSAIIHVSITDAHFDEAAKDTWDVFGTLSIQIAFPDKKAHAIATLFTTKKHSQLLVDSRHFVPRSRIEDCAVDSRFIADPATRNILDMFVRTAFASDRDALQEARETFVQHSNFRSRVPNIEQLFFLAYPLTTIERKLALIDVLLQLNRVASLEENRLTNIFFQTIVGRMDFFAHEKTENAMKLVQSFQAIFDFYYKQKPHSNIDWQLQKEFIDAAVNSSLFGTFKYWANAAIERAQKDKSVSFHDVASFFERKIPEIVAKMLATSYNREACFKFVTSLYAQLNLEFGLGKLQILRFVFASFNVAFGHTADLAAYMRLFSTLDDAFIAQNWVAFVASVEQSSSEVFFNAFHANEDFKRILQDQSQFVKDAVLLVSFRHLFSATSAQRDQKQIDSFFAFLFEVGARVPSKSLAPLLLTFEKCPKIDALLRFAELFNAEAHENVRLLVTEPLVAFAREVYYALRSADFLVLFSDAQVRRMAMVAEIAADAEFGACLSRRIAAGAETRLKAAVQRLGHLSKSFEVDAIAAQFAALPSDAERGLLLSIFLLQPSHVEKDNVIRAYVNMGLGCKHLLHNSDVYEVFFSGVLFGRMPFKVAELEVALSRSYCPVWDDAIFARLKSSKNLQTAMAAIIRHHALHARTAVEYLTFEVCNYKDFLSKKAFFTQNFISLLKSIRYCGIAQLRASLLHDLADVFLCTADCIGDIVDFFVINDCEFDNRSIVAMFEYNSNHLIVFLDFLHKAENCLIARYQLSFNEMFYIALFKQIFGLSTEFRFGVTQIVDFVLILLRFDQQNMLAFNLNALLCYLNAENVLAFHTFEALKEKFANDKQLSMWINSI